MIATFTPAHVFAALLPAAEIPYEQALRDLYYDMSRPDRIGLVDEAFDILDSLVKALADGTLLGKPYIGTSGGKDSVTVHHVFDAWAKSKDHHSFVPIVHTPKPEETHPLTKTFLYSRQYPITFVPKQHHRPFTERYELTTQIDGSRISEFSRAESGRSTDFVKDGVNVSREHMTPIVPNGLFGLNFVYPLLNWKDEHVWAYILSQGIPFSDEYLEGVTLNITVDTLKVDATNITTN